MNEYQSVTVVIPAYNEEISVGGLISGIRTLNPGFKILVVDDGSSDDTKGEAEAAGATVISHYKNLGNGAAIKTGIRNSDSEITVFMDADGQHRPEEIEKIVAGLDRADMVVGARELSSHATLFRMAANYLYNLLASYVTGEKVRDLTSGFRGAKTVLLKEFIPLIPNTFSYPTTLLMGFMRSGYIVEFVTVKVRERKGGRSKIKLIRDGARFLFIIGKITTLYSPIKIFFPVGIFFFLCGTANYLYTYIRWHRLTNMTAILFIASILVFLMGLISEQISQLYFDRPGQKYND